MIAVRIQAPHVQRRQTDAGRGVPSHRLDNDILLGHEGELLHHVGFLQAGS